MFCGVVINDDSLTKVLTELEKQVGEKVLSALRREATRRGVSVLKLLGDSVVVYAGKLAHAPSHAGPTV